MARQLRAAFSKNVVCVLPKAPVPPLAAYSVLGDSFVYVGRNCFHKSTLLISLPWTAHLRGPK